MIFCTWTGKSGQSYRYEVYAYDTEFNEVAVNYCVAKVVNNRYQPIYFGQTVNLRERFKNHERKDCFKRHKATQIHVYQNALESIRKSHESDMIESYQPVCNGEK